jgi:hypothetical protein
MAESDEHLKPLRLFDLARFGESKATDVERAHLLACEECQPILEVFVRQFGKPTEGKPKDAA